MARIKNISFYNFKIHILSKYIYLKIFVVLIRIQKVTEQE